MRPVRYTLSDASGGVVVGAVVPLDIYLNPFNVSLQVVVDGTATFTVEYTEDDIWADGYDPDAASSKWIPLANMDDEAADANDTLVSAVSGVRMRQLTGDGSVALTVMQSGAVG